jgi:hypothetical protein
MCMVHTIIEGEHKFPYRVMLVRVGGQREVWTIATESFNQHIYSHPDTSLLAFDDDVIYYVPDSVIDSDEDCLKELRENLHINFMFIKFLEMI